MVAALDGQEGPGPRAANMRPHLAANLAIVPIVPPSTVLGSELWSCTLKGCERIQPIQHLCRAKQPIWTPTRCMRSGMLQGHVGAKVAASDGRAASRKGSLCPTRFSANSAFVPRQAADLDSDARHAL
eukprot:2625700-Rhodomonas_salina.1